jgi:spore coat polysaccharide biosynthesis protein SpsF
VLSRYYEAAKAHHADVVVRITSDCPLYDAALLDAMLARFETANVDYLSNCIERHYPRGLDTEIFTFAALEKAFYEAHLPHEREHVTPYLYQHPELFSVQSFVGEGDDFSHLRWTLDTDEDWQLVSRIYHALYEANPLFSTADILALIAREPEIATINAHIEQKKLA